MNSNSFLIVAASFIGLTGLILDAIGTHALRHWLQESPVLESLISSWQTATRTQLIHGVFLIGLIALREKLNSSWVTVSSTCTILGLLLFSGSIYVKVWTGLPGATSIAPLGGVLLMLGWLSLGLAAIIKPPRGP